MACYTISPFIGPVLGPAFSGFINQARISISLNAAPAEVKPLEHKLALDLLYSDYLGYSTVGRVVSGKRRLEQTQTFLSEGAYSLSQKHTSLCCESRKHVSMYI